MCTCNCIVVFAASFLFLGSEGEESDPILSCGFGGHLRFGLYEEKIKEGGKERGNIKDGDGI
jgi:hypothetical protein